MRRFMLLLLALLLLTGCANNAASTSLSTEQTQPTDPPVSQTEESPVPQVEEAPVPWTEEVGMAWDEAGVMLEMPLTIPDGLHYSSSMAYDGDLLLWSVENHLTDVFTVELCVVELDDGSIIAQRDIELSEYVTPQILGDDLYLCDWSAGAIIRLDKDLQTVKQWNTEPEEGCWYMGEGEMLYLLDNENRLSVRDLSNGQSSTVLDGDPEIISMTVYDGYSTVEYYRIDTGAKGSAVLDLNTGSIDYPAFGGEFSSVELMNGDWLCGKYIDGYVFYISVDGGDAMRLPRGESNFTLLREGYLLETAEDGTYLRLYNLDGSLVSSACIFASGSGYAGQCMIWNETLGGYFLQVANYGETSRLLFWDISKSAGGADLTLTEVPEPDEAQAQLQQRAEEIGQTYGLTVLLGEDCNTVFGEFTAEQVTDWDRVTMALDTLEEALASYPAGFIQQLRYNDIQGIQIQLVCDLWADGEGRYGDDYAAFTQPEGDYYLMVVDIDNSSAETYYHELSHIIDAYLEWDAEQRDDALFSEDTWASLNPDWFSGYSFEYSKEHDLPDYNSFIDGYSTIKPTEDRARIMEYAMAGCSWAFEDADGLMKKLDYYSRCIRDAFDTTAWPDTTLWEESLN